MAKKRDPKVGTGKKPKGSGRRLYTDENPKDTVELSLRLLLMLVRLLQKLKRYLNHLQGRYRY